MKTFAEMIDARDSLAACMGDCETVRMVSREILKRLRADWLPTTKKALHLFLTEDYKAKIVNVFNTAYEDGGAKIPAIKCVRQDWEDLGNDRLGLLEAKLYVEWVCNCQSGYHPAFGEFMKKIGG